MRVYYCRCYWPWNLFVVVRCVTYISNLKKRATGISDRRTDKHSTDVKSVQYHALHWTDNKTDKNQQFVRSNWVRCRLDLFAQRSDPVQSTHSDNKQNHSLTAKYTNNLL